MLSKPDNFRFHLEELAKHASDGIDSVRSGIKELEALGYVKRFANKVKGRVVSWDMVIYEIPELDNPILEDEQIEQPELDFPELEKPHVENPMLRTNDLRTNDIKNERKTYVTFDEIDDEYIQLYNRLFIERFNKPHKRVTEDQLQEIFNMMHFNDSRYCLDIEEFEEVAKRHLMNLPEGNDGDIRPFLLAYTRLLDDVRYP